MTSSLHPIPTSAFAKSVNTYDEYAMPQRWAAETLLALLPDECESICELGCGSGILTQRLAAKYPEVPLLAVDSVSSFFQSLEDKLKGSSMHWKQVDLNRELPEVDADLYVSSATFHWLDDIGDVLTRLRSQATPGTDLAFSIMTKGTLEEVRSCRNEVCPGLPPVRELPDWNDIPDLVRNAGWEVKIYFLDAFVRAFDSASDLLRSLQKTGVNGFPYGRGPRPLLRGELKKIEDCLQKKYDDELQGIPCTYRCGFIFAHAE